MHAMSLSSISQSDSISGKVSEGVYFRPGSHDP